MKRISATLFMVLLLCGVNLAQSDQVSFGEVRLRIDDGPARNFNISSVNLYQNVSIDYDTTLIVQGKGKPHLYFYPQLSGGKQMVLHLILTPLDDSAAKSYDFFFNLGDTLPERISFSGRDSTVFVVPGSEFVEQRAYSRAASGSFNLLEQEGSNDVAGDFQCEFDYPLADGKRHHFTISGDVKILSKNFLLGEATSLVLDKERNSSLGRELGIGLLLGLMIILFALR